MYRAHSAVSKGFDSAKSVANNRRQFMEDCEQLKTAGWRFCRLSDGIGVDCSPARMLSVDGKTKGHVAVFVVGSVNMNATFILNRM